MSTAANKPRPGESLDDLQRRIAALQASTRRSTITTVVMGIIALVLMTFYFGYAYRQVVDLTTPDSVVTVVDQVLSDNLPGARQALQTQIQESSPDWAAQLSEQCQASVPQLRLAIEDFVLNQVDEQLAEVELVSSAEFRTFLTENKDDLRRQARQLKQNQQLPDETMQQFVGMFDKHFEVSFEDTTAGMFETLFNMNKKLMRLKANQGLTPEEQQERRLIMLAKAVQGDSQPSTKAVAEASPRK